MAISLPASQPPAWRFSGPAVIVAAGTFAGMLAYVLVVTAHFPGIDQERTQRTAHITLALLTASVCLYLLWYRGGVYKRFWRAFWTVSFLAFVVHLWFAVTGMFGGNVAAVFQNKGLVTHPVFDTLLTLWWGADVILAWTINPETGDRLIRWSRALALVVFPLAFFFATHETYKVSQAAPLLGDLALLVIAGFALFWASVRKPLVVPG